MTNKFIKSLCLGIGCFIGISVVATPDEAIEFKGESAAKSQLSADNEIRRQGLMGHFFEKNNFTKPMVASPTSKDGLGYDLKTGESLGLSKQTYQSFRWLGYLIMPSAEGVNLSVKGVDDFKIEIQGKVFTKEEPATKVTLKKDQPLEIKIEATMLAGKMAKDLGDIQLISHSAAGKEVVIGDNQLKNPEFGSEKWQTKLASASQDNLFKLTGDEAPLLDTDGDNIFDKWEIEGYTIKNKVAVAWQDQFGSQGYTKYRSNPLNAHTAGDPYSDYEKAARDIPVANSKETFNPLVAAFPAVTVNLEKVILSKNIDMSASVASSHSTNWTYANTLGAALQLGWAGFGPSFGISGNYQYSSSTAQEWGGSKDSTTHLNSAETAYLNANIRYHNTGTGAMYEVKPTTSFVLEDATMGTIQARDNSKALSLPAKSSYPKKGSHGIALNTMDDFNSKPITLNRQQLTRYLKNKAPLLLETDQTEGKYSKIDAFGQVVLGDQWHTVEDQIKGRTASLIVDFGDGVMERRVAGKNYDDPEDKTPSITIKEALKLAFQDEVSEDGGELWFAGVPLSEYSLLSFVDKKTASMIKKQLNDNRGPFKEVKKIYDVKLEPEMAITLKQGMFYNGAEKGQLPMTGLNLFVEQQSGKSQTGVNNYYSNAFSSSTYKHVAFGFPEKTLGEMNRNSRYYLSFSIAEDPNRGNIPSQKEIKMSIETNLGQATNSHRFTIGNKYKRVTVPILNPGSGDGRVIGFNVEYKNPGASSVVIRIDDIAIVEVGTI